MRTHTRADSWDIAVRALLVAGLLSLAANAAAVTLTDVSYTSEAGMVRFVLTTDAAPPQPNVFTTDQPTRIVLELPDTASTATAGRIPVGVGPVQSYMAVSAENRTRLVVDLARPTTWDVAVEGNRVILEILTAAAASAAPVGQGTAEIGMIDFRRGPGGEGRVIVNLDRPGVNVSVNERGAQLRVDLFNTRLPERLRERLDVTDFATPVQRITTEPHGDNVRLLLEIAGPYEHVAYQTADQFVVEVSRPPVEPDHDRELRFFEEREYEGDRITLNFQDIPVRSVLQLIADVSELNIVVSDSVTGNVTLRLTNIPWDQALDIVMETKNLDMRRSGNVIWVAPAAEIAAREQLILRARAERQILEPLRTSMIQISYASADDLAVLIREASAARTDEGLLSERGSVTVDSRTNTLLVTDTTDRIEAIRALVQELDRPVRQVLIESRIVIARHDFNHELGVRFGVTGSSETSSRLVTTSGDISSTDRMGSIGLINREIGARRVIVPGSGDGGANREFRDGPIISPPLDERLNVNLPVANPAGRLGFAILTRNFLLDLELSALEAEGQGEVISTPRVITANGGKGIIKQGVEIPFEQATTAGATAVQFREAVLELNVVPLITPDNRVQMELLVKQDTVGEIFQTGRGGTVPSIDKREVTTRVLVENGQTVVLGGIFQEERNFNVSKVPVLGDLPVLGVLFRRRATDDQKRELLIFVTPTILDERLTLD